MIVVVGDIHGYLDPLKALIKRKERSGKRWGFNMEYLFLGDYIDRGPCIKEVLDYLIAKETGKVLQVDLDTGAVYGGRLSSITFPETDEEAESLSHMNTTLAPVYVDLSKGFYDRWLRIQEKFPSIEYFVHEG
jgi:hypothetical protein